MGNRRNILVMISLLAVTTACAEPISESRARQIATQFMANRSMPSTTLRKARKAPMAATDSSEKAAYYVFNANEGGYVIVAGDDRAPAVLGYSENGTFDDHDIPEAMQSMLDGYAAQIAALEQGAKAAPQLTSGNAVAPLIQSQWSHQSPFNILLPTLSLGNHASVGCVATALAQVMYYWKWPERPTCPLPAYTTKTLGFYMPKLPVADFRWDLMKNNYETTDTVSDEAMAAAMLSLYCAQAVKMDFLEEVSETLAPYVPNFAATYFDYDSGAHMENRENYSTQGWADLIYGELAAGRPIIYSGSRMDGGHTFICDGFDGNGLFHINWGWNSRDNGYFLLNVLNPEDQGTRNTYGVYSYVKNQGAIVGFQPNKGGSNNVLLTATGVALNSYTNTRSATSDAFKFNVSGAFRNHTSDTIAVRFGWGLFKEDEMVKKLLSSSVKALIPGYYINLSKRELKVGAGITSGTYRILPMCGEVGKDDWRPCAGADHNYIEVTINGSKCTATGHGTAGTPNYTINNIDITGYMHNGQSINVDVNMTNKGHSSNHLLYMFVNGQLVATNYVSLELGETGNIHYTYLFEDAGNYTLTWSWNEDGSNPVSTRNITINPMPAANLSATLEVLNVTDAEGKVITSDKFSVVLTITNNGNTAYDEDISAKLYKHTHDADGSNVQGINQHLTLAPGETTTMQFDMTNVAHNWQYFVKTYFYSEGEQKLLANGTSSFLVIFPKLQLGDVTGDGILNVADVTALVDIILSEGTMDYDLKAADVDKDEKITVADVTALVDLILGQRE